MLEGRKPRSTANPPRPLVVRAVDVTLDPGSLACLRLEPTKISAELFKDGYTRELELEQDAAAHLDTYEEESAFAFVAMSKTVGEKLMAKEQRLVETWLHHFHGRRWRSSFVVSMFTQAFLSIVCLKDLGW